MTGHQGGGVITMTLIVALLLTLVPLPHWLDVLRPNWVSLTLIYWCLALPNRIGVGVGWMVGLLLDVATGALLGQHALALALVAFLAVKLHQRVRLYPVWQQALSVVLMVALQELLSLWIMGITHQAPQSWAYWLAVLTSMLVWPPVYTTLRAVRRRYHVH
jgi:rod shape-determining protein MreD